MIPETLEAHRQRLLNAGFERALVWYQCFNFVSILAIK
jgi:tRNA (cmo5U34)-methyltransferase